MKKGLNNETSGRRFTLPKNKILRGRTNFQKLFERKAQVVKGAKVNMRFRIYNNGESECKMAFIVPKRLGKAVRRNRMKRLLKEAYRLNQYLIADEVAEACCTFHGALMAKTADVEYDDVRSDVIDLLHRVQSCLQKHIE